MVRRPGTPVQLKRRPHGTEKPVPGSRLCRTLSNLEILITRLHLQETPPNALPRRSPLRPRTNHPHHRLQIPRPKHHPLPPGFFPLIQTKRKELPPPCHIKTITPVTSKQQSVPQPKKRVPESHPGTRFFFVFKFSTDLFPIEQYIIPRSPRELEGGAPRTKFT